MAESKKPASRLCELLNTNFAFFGIASASAFVTPHDDFHAVGAGLKTLCSRDRLPHEQCVLNFTGGNKLMATAACEWARQNAVPAF